MTTASNSYSVAIGQGSVASGLLSFAMGANVTSSGKSSLALGYQSQATAGYSTAMGYYTSATGYGATAFGNNTTASSNYSTAMGEYTKASGSNSLAMGDYVTWNSPKVYEYTEAAGYSSIALGRGVTAKSMCMVAVGQLNEDFSGSLNNWVQTDPLFVVGNGTWANIGPGGVVDKNNAMTILKNGNVGIGTSTPSSLLHINGGDIRLEGGNIINISGGITIGNANTGWFSDNTSLSARIPNSTSGDFWVQSAGGASVYMRVGPGIGGLYLVTGSAWKPGGGSWAVPSDGRLKNIHGEYAKGIDDIIALNPVLFSYKNDNPKGLPSSEEYVGLVAQDVQKIFPEAVSEAKDGYLNFDMHPVNVALINAVKELNNKIESSKLENQKLKAEVDELKALVNSLIANQTEPVRK
jgi:hypothetical protein